MTTTTKITQSIPAGSSPNVSLQKVMPSKEKRLIEQPAVSGDLIRYLDEIVDPRDQTASANTERDLWFLKGKMSVIEHLRAIQLKQARTVLAETK